MKQGGDPRRFGYDISEAEFFFHLKIPLDKYQLNLN